MLIAWLAVIIFPKEILSVFTTDKAMIVSGEHALKLYFFGFFFMSFQFVGQSTFTALGCAKRAVFFSIIQESNYSCSAYNYSSYAWAWS